jgi:hypothetical protein
MLSDRPHLLCEETVVIPEASLHAPGHSSGAADGCGSRGREGHPILFDIDDPWFDIAADRKTGDRQGQRRDRRTILQFCLIEV